MLLTNMCKPKLLCLQSGSVGIILNKGNHYSSGSKLFRTLQMPNGSNYPLQISAAAPHQVSVNRGGGSKMKKHNYTTTSTTAINVTNWTKSIFVPHQQRCPCSICLAAANSSVLVSSQRSKSTETGGEVSKDENNSSSSERQQQQQHQRKLTAEEIEEQYYEQTAGKTADQEAKDQKNAKRYGPFSSGQFWSMMGLFTFGGVYLFIGYPEKDDPNQAMDFVNYHKRFLSHFNGMYDALAAPSQDYLLPPKNPNMCPSPYTLILEIEDVLIHSEWTSETGWRVRKRPGALEFLNYLFQYYEIVFFTDSPAMSAAPFATELNKYSPVSYFLFRDSTRYVNFKYVKDLRSLNRDLSKVVLIDTSDSHYSYTPDNGITIPKWDGNPNDRTLFDLMEFFETMATSGIHDFRPVLKFYKGKDVVATFKERQHKLKLQLEMSRNMNRGHGGWGSNSSSKGSSSSFFGTKPKSDVNKSSSAAATQQSNTNDVDAIQTNDPIRLAEQAVLKEEALMKQRKLALKQQQRDKEESLTLQHGPNTNTQDNGPNGGSKWWPF